MAFTFTKKKSLPTANCPLLTELASANRADCEIFFYQKPDPAKRQAKENHYSEYYPTCRRDS
jgi:hypothetical protein